MTKKILFVASIHKHFLAFHLPYINWLKDNGCIVHVAANGTDKVPNVDKQWNVCIERNPFSLNNIKAVNCLKKIIEENSYDLVHCHTAMGAVVARLAARENRNRGITKVLYTAHGFHFFKGSPKRYWLMYYPMEKFLLKYTDGIITINNEDYNLVNSHNFKNRDLYLTHGVGINTERLSYITGKTILKKGLGYNENTLIFIYIAEHISRKNHKFIIDVAAKLKNHIQDFKILFAGRGVLFDSNKKYAERKGVSDCVDFLGFRRDIGNLLNISDIGLSASHQEGLPVSVMEEFYTRIPVVATKIRGHVDLIKDGVTGYLYEDGDINGCIDSIIKLLDKNHRKIVGNKAYDYIQDFRLDRVVIEMAEIYSKQLNI